MTKILGFPADISLAMLAVAAAYLLLAHTPVLLAGIFVHWPVRLKRKLLFVGVSSALTYGVLLLTATVVVIPLQALALFVLPEWNAQGYYETFPPLRWVAGLASFIWDWWYVAWPLCCGIVGWFVISRLARRWNAIVEASAG